LTHRYHVTLPYLALLVALSASWAFAAGAGPLVTAPYLAGPVGIDGAFELDEWDLANGLCAFVDVMDGKLSAAQPEVYLSRDDAALYVAARLPLPRGKYPVARVDARDGNLWDDDALEVFIDPGTTTGDYYQFIVNSRAVQWDSKGKDKSWDAEWTAAAGVEKTYWVAEMRIPFASLGVDAPEDGDAWRVNFAWDRKTPAPLIASWSHLSGTLHKPEAFGTLAFASGTPVVHIAGPGDPWEGSIGFAGKWGAGVASEASLKVVRHVDDEEMVVGDKRAVHPGGGAVADLVLAVMLPKDERFVAAGDYTVSLTVTEKGKPVYVAGAPMTVLSAVNVTLDKYLLTGGLKVRADIAGVGIFERNARVRANLLGPDGKKLASRLLRRTLGTTRFAHDFDIAELAPGDYSVEVVAVGRKGHLLKREIAVFTKPEPPDWLGSREGVTDEVLPPWTPVEVDGSTVKVWGREYGFDTMPFPKEVQAAGESILAGPITLKLTADGTEYTWASEQQATTMETAPNEALLVSSATAGKVRCSGEIAVEYDGMVRCDFTISAKGVKSIEDMTLVVPIKEQHAKYLYHFPGRWRSAYNAGALPEDGFTSAFRPFIWLGDEDRGLAWFSESDRNFFVDDADKVVEIKRERGVATLRVHMIQGQYKPGKPLDYTFGFQATPVKPLDPDVWDYRICHQGGYGIEDQPWFSPATITYPAEGNVNLEQGTFEAWIRPVFDPQPDIAADDPGRGVLNRNLFSVDFPGGDRIGFYWNVDDRGMRVYYRRGTTHPLVMGHRADWKAGEWHHVAFSWGDKTRIFIDGSQVAESDYKGTIPGDLSEAKILIGESPSEFDIDEIRISSIARDYFDLTQPAAQDRFTLLLDRLDSVDPNLTERPTAPEVGTAGVAKGGTVLNGKWGYAYALYQAGTKKNKLDRLAELGVRTLVFHEHWTDIQNYTSTTHGEKLHKLVKACHERGIKLLLYFGYEISNIAPEWDLYANECLVAPRRGGYHRLPEQNAYIVCYNSKWQDFMADGIAKMIDEYDIDGVYLDGTANPWGCSNTLHGCGYEKPDGTMGTTYRIFATRDMMRRIYTLVKTRKPDGQVNVHQSTCMTIPTLAWATSYWDGEQFGGIQRGADPLEVLPMDAFRCEFMGRQWGVPAEFLCYNRPYTYKEAMAFTLLHDVLVRGALGGSLELESKLWHAMEEFGRKGSVYLPYWAETQYVTIGPDDSIKASIYSRAEDGCVIVVSNLGADTTNAEVDLDLEGLALPAAVTATDVLTDATVAVDKDGRMAFPLDSFGFRVLWVKPK